MPTIILDPLPERADRRVEFIWESVKELKQSLEQASSGLIVLHGKATREIPALARKHTLERYGARVKLRRIV
ncbi:MAG: deoxyribodipyrimidine photo-lyase [Burkholderiales bacterium]